MNTLKVRSLVNNDPNLSNHSLGSPCLQVGVSSSPLGYREPNNDETSVTTFLDSLLPFIHDQNSTVQLHVYLGKYVINPSTDDGEASSSHYLVEGAGKEFAWSRVLGIEHSLVKTRSAWKKSATFSSLENNPRIATDGGALRALKALSREK
jgi:hypothetical protein